MSAEGGGGSQSAMTQCWDLHGDDRTRVPHLHVESGPSAETAGATRPDIPGPLVMPADEFAAVRAVAEVCGSVASAGAPASVDSGQALSAPHGQARERTGASQPGVRERLEAALDASIDGCARCKVCDTQIGAAMTVLGPLLERAEAAEAKLDEVRRAIAAFFTHHGNSAAFALQSARDLGEGIRQVLDREALEALEGAGAEPGP